jgi:hypothetical protein
MENVLTLATFFFEPESFGKLIIAPNLDMRGLIPKFTLRWDF